MDCFSPASLAKPKSYRNAEFALAIDELQLRAADDQWLIPVRFAHCDIPDLDIGGRRTLRSLQAADLFGVNHRACKTKARQAFPAAGRNITTRTAPARILLCGPIAA
jgi:hypothetical protein